MRKQKHREVEVICSGSRGEKAAEAGTRRACVCVAGLWLGAEEGSDLWPVVPTFVQPLERAHCLRFAP